MNNDPFSQFLHVQMNSKDIIKQHVPAPKKNPFIVKPYPASHYSLEDQMEIYYADDDAFIVCDKYNISQTTYEAICRKMERKVKLEIERKKRDNWKKEVRSAKGTLEEVAKRFKVSISTVFVIRNNLTYRRVPEKNDQSRKIRVPIEVQS